MDKYKKYLQLNYTTLFTSSFDWNLTAAEVSILRLAEKAGQLADARALVREQKLKQKNKQPEKAKKSLKMWARVVKVLKKNSMVLTTVALVIVIAVIVGSLTL